MHSCMSYTVLFKKDSVKLLREPNVEVGVVRPLPNGPQHAYMSESGHLLMAPREKCCRTTIRGLLRTELISHMIVT